MSETRLLRRNIVERRTGLARSTIYSRMRNGTFPKSVPVGKFSVRWREEDIDLFIKNPGSWAIDQVTSAIFSAAPMISEEAGE